ncbi:MAG: rod shape-determining protein MreC [Oscillospiraceae bacterium]|nr:rod shape-determining protein MreC [Oscillospiraceae bacterium]
MKILVTRRSIIIATASLVIALISIISVNVFSSAGPVTGIANTVTMPVRALVSTVARAFGNIYASIYRYEELLARHEDLLRTNVQLQTDFRNARELALENDRLRELLEWRERHGGYTSEMATFVNWNSDNWSSSFVINKGYTNSDIAPGMAVATEYDVLIGQVSEVGPIESIVITVLDTTFSAAAFVGGDGSDEAADGSATVKGDFAYMRGGLLILDHIDDDLTVTPGVSVFTSGGGAVFPSGLTVGEVERVFNHTNGIGRFATVRPTRGFENISTVFIIIDFENPE